MQRITIARFDAVRTANIVAALYAVIVLVDRAPVRGAVRARGPRGRAGGRRPRRRWPAASSGVLLVLLLAVVFYGGIGWVMTALVCALYNVLAGRIGGIRVEVQPEGPALMGPGGPGWPAPAPIAPGPASTADHRRPAAAAVRLGPAGLTVSGSAW